MKVCSTVGIALLHLLPSVTSKPTPYIWPSQTDELEDIMHLQSGYLRRGFVDGISNVVLSVS